MTWLPMVNLLTARCSKILTRCTQVVLVLGLLIAQGLSGERMRACCGFAPCAAESSDGPTENVPTSEERGEESPVESWYDLFGSHRTTREAAIVPKTTHHWGPSFGNHRRNRLVLQSQTGRVRICREPACLRC